MPDYFSHGVIAEVIYEKLNSKYKKAITSKNLYLLGAQGGDVFFAYSIKPTKANLGRSLHRKDAVYLFGQLVQGDKSYAAGFATHYALDSTLHPYIYAYENTKRSPFAHTKFENDLGLYISRKYGLRRQIIPKDLVLACTSPVYDTMKRIEPLITVTGVERCLSRHFAYSRFLFRTKRQNYRCDYDFSKLSQTVESAVEYGIEAVTKVLEGDIDIQLFSKEFLQK